METITMKFADITVSADLLYKETAKLFEKYFTEEAPMIHVVSTPEEIEKQRDEWTKYANQEHLPKHIQDWNLEYTEIHRLVSEQTIGYDMLLFHGSALAVDGQTYIFTAPSGTGKSTHASLWRKYLGNRVVMVNDDKPFLICREDAVYACGTPWDGKHHLSTDITLPVRAICILTRGTENQIEEITAIEAFDTMFRQCIHFETAEREEMVLEMLNRILNNVKFYRLACNMELDAARIAYEKMSEKTLDL